MVDISYDRTVCSFRYGTKNPRIVYVIAVVTTLALTVMSACLLLYYALTGSSEGDDIAAFIVCCAIFLPMSVLLVGVGIYEHFVVRKGIQRCISAEDAEIRTVVPFMFSSAYGGIFSHCVYKAGVKFRYRGRKITRTMKKYAYIKKYIGVEVDIVYSALCDDVVILKPEDKVRRRPQKKGS